MSIQTRSFQRTQSYAHKQRRKKFRRLSSNPPPDFWLFHSIAFFSRVIFFTWKFLQVILVSIMNILTLLNVSDRKYTIIAHTYFMRALFMTRAHIARAFSRFHGQCFFNTFISSFIYSDHFLVMIRFSLMIRCVTAKICQSGLGLSNGLSLEVKRMLEKKSGLNNVPHGKGHNLKILNFFLLVNREVL